MEPISFLKTLAAYLKSRWQLIFFYVLSLVIFLLVYSLYHVPLEPALYASLLVTTLSFFLFLHRFSVFYRKHTALTVLRQFCGGHLGKLPKTLDPLERDYQLLAVELEQSKKRALFDSSKAQSDALHYYTLWVHQIKTPISAMRLLLQESGEGDKESMKQELFKIEQYVEMVLQYIRLGNLSNDLILEEYPLSSLVRQAAKKTSTLFIHKQIELSLSVPDSGVNILTDEKWMVFVLEQLLTNAVKYTPRGKVSLYLTTPDFNGAVQDGIPADFVSSTPSCLTLAIEDTGIGIRREDLPRVFEWGFTGFNGRDDKKSTGIGLYLCKQVLDRLGHELRIDSTLGQGTRVFLTFSTKRLKTD